MQRVNQGNSKITQATRPIVSIASSATTKVENPMYPAGPELADLLPIGSATTKSSQTARASCLPSHVTTAGFRAIINTLFLSSSLVSQQYNSNLFSDPGKNSERDDSFCIWNVKMTFWFKPWLPTAVSCSHKNVRQLTSLIMVLKKIGTPGRNYPKLKNALNRSS